MQDNAIILNNAVLYDDLAILSNATMIDYGFRNIPEEDQQILFGLYQGMVKFKNVNADILRQCFRSNRLDELIHKKYKHHPSKYYQLWVERGHMIGDTYFDFKPSDESSDESNDEFNEFNEFNDKFDILDDDTCPGCGGSLGANVYNDCEKCLIIKCAECLDDDICIQCM